MQTQVSTAKGAKVVAAIQPRLLIRRCLGTRFDLNESWCILYHNITKDFCEIEDKSTDPACLQWINHSTDRQTIILNEQTV